MHKIEMWHFTQLASAQAYQKEVIEIVNSRYPRKEVIDIGCGIGFLSRKLNFTKYTGLDNSEATVKLARSLSKDINVVFTKKSAMDIENFEISPNSVILSLNFLHCFSLEEINSFFLKILNMSISATLIFDIPNRIYSLDDIRALTDRDEVHVILKRTDEKFNRELFVLRVYSD